MLKVNFFYFNFVFNSKIKLLNFLGSLFRIFKKYSFDGKFDYEYIYPTNQDAVLSINNRKVNSTFSAINTKSDMNNNDNNNESIEPVNQSSSIDELIIIEPISN